jgi:hypothetical protein
VLGARWPLNKFWEHLVIFDHFWDFDSLLKMECQTKRRLHNLNPLLGPFLGFGEYVMGKGCRPVGLPMLRPTFVCINRRIGNVRQGVK